MKTKTFFSFLFLIAVIFSCSKDKDDNSENESPRKLGQVGNEWKAELPGGGQLSSKVIANNNGIIDLQVYYNNIYDTLKVKLSDNSISDFVYSDGDESKPFTLVKFDAQVGDIHTFTSGKFQVEREVFERETYEIPALAKEVETIGVAENFPPDFETVLYGYTIIAVYWYISPVYGLVCIELLTSDYEWLIFEFTDINL